MRVRGKIGQPQGRSRVLSKRQTRLQRQLKTRGLVEDSYGHQHFEKPGRGSQ